MVSCLTTLINTVRQSGDFAEPCPGIPPFRIFLVSGSAKAKPALRMIHQRKPESSWLFPDGIASLIMMSAMRNIGVGDGGREIQIRKGSSMLSCGYISLKLILQVVQRPTYVDTGNCVKHSYRGKREVGT